MHHRRHTHFWSHFFNNKDMNHFYIGVTIRWFSVALYLLFLPGYLYEIGFSFREIAFFFFIWTFAQSFFSLFASWFGHKYSIKKLIFLSTFTLVILNFGFPLLETHKSMYPLVALWAAFSTACFWVGYHCFFTKTAEKKNRGRKIGALTFITGVFMMISPVIGGFILENLGSYILFFLAPVFILASLLPLRKIRGFKIEKKIRIKALSIKKSRAVAFAATGFTGMAIVIFWPLFLFLILDGFVILGVVSFLTSLFSLVINVVAGWLTDKMGEKKVMRFASFSESFLWVCRLFATIPIVAVIIDALDKSVWKIYQLSVDARSYTLASHHHIEMIVAREFWGNIGGAVICLLLVIYPSFGLAFTLAALGALWTLLL